MASSTRSRSNYYCNICDVCRRIINPGIISSNQHMCRYCGDIVCCAPSCSGYYEYNGLTLRTCATCHKKHRSQQHNELLNHYMIHCAESLIAGYYRNYGADFIVDHLPNDILNLICLWKGTACNEQWRESSHYASGSIIISQGKQCIEVVNGSNDAFYSAFGTNTIQKGMVKTWDFKIGATNHKLKQSHIFIGIVSVNDIPKFEEQNIVNDDNDAFIGYGLHLKDGALRNRNVGSKQKLFRDAFATDGIGVDDVITMTLDLKSSSKHGKLSYQIARKYHESVVQTAAFHPKIDDEWVLAVKLKNNEKLILIEYLADWILIHTD